MRIIEDFEMYNVDLPEATLRADVTRALRAGGMDRRYIHTKWELVIESLEMLGQEKSVLEELRTVEKKVMLQENTYQRMWEQEQARHKADRAIQASETIARKTEDKGNRKLECFSWQKTGTCHRGDKCKYLHKSQGTGQQGGANKGARGLGQKKIECFRCGGNHYARDCNQPPAQRIDSARHASDTVVMTKADIEALVNEVRQQSVQTDTRVARLAKEREDVDEGIAARARHAEATRAIADKLMTRLGDSNKERARVGKTPQEQVEDDQDYDGGTGLGLDDQQTRALRSTGEYASDTLDLGTHTHHTRSHTHYDHIDMYTDTDNDTYSEHDSDSYGETSSESDSELILGMDEYKNQHYYENYDCKNPDWYDSDSDNTTNTKNDSDVGCQRADRIEISPRSI